MKPGKGSYLLMAAVMAAVGFALLAGRLPGIAGTMGSACMQVLAWVEADPGRTVVAAVAAFGALAVAGLLAGLVCLFRTARLVRAVRASTVEPTSAPLQRVVRRLGLEGRVRVTSDRAFVAFTHGLAKPSIVISSGLIEALEEAELEALLRHERSHLEARDPLRLLLVRTFSTAFSFVPYASSLVEAYLARRELAADRATVRDMGDVLPLASALHHAVASSSGRPFTSLAVSGVSATDLRIDQLLGVETSPRLLLRRPGKLQILLSSFAATAALCLLVSAVQLTHIASPCIPC